MTNKRISYTNILSKECIVSAILQLIKDKPLSSINVSELCKKAGVSRMTFYRNYDSIEDIFMKHLNEIFEEYKTDDSLENTRGLYCDEYHLFHYFNYIYKHREFLYGLVQCGFDMFFLSTLTQYIIEKWSCDSDKYTLISFAGTLYNMFHIWSKNNFSDNKDDMIDVIARLYNKQYDT